MLGDARTELLWLGLKPLKITPGVLAEAGVLRGSVIRVLMLHSL